MSTQDLKILSHSFSVPFLFLGPFQLTAMAFNTVTVFLTSLDIYLTNRLAVDPNEKRSFMHKISTPIFIFLQMLGHLAAWIIIASCIEEYSVICMFLTILTVIIALKYFFNFKDDKKIWNKTIESNQSKKYDAILWTAMISSWITPSTLWCDNFAQKEIFKLSECKRRKYFMVISSTACTLSQLFYIGVICLLINNSCQTNTSEIGPILECVGLNEGTYQLPNVTNRSDLTLKNYLMTNNECDIQYVRYCKAGEDSSDLLIRSIIPIIIGLLLLGSVATWILKFKGKLFLLSVMILSSSFY